MNYRRYLCISFLFFLFSVNAQAEYKTMGDMTQEEYQKVGDASADYNECLNEYAMSQLDKQNDVRVIADHAMKTCSPILEELNTDLLSENYSPEVTGRFVSRIANKASNKLLSNLMVFMASRQQTQQ